MRLFAAIKLPEDISARIAKCQSGLRPCFNYLASSGNFVKWVDTHNLHITLCFFGETDPKNLPMLRQVLERTAEGILPFQVCVDGFQVFPTFTAAKVLTGRLLSRDICQSPMYANKAPLNALADSIRSNIFYYCQAAPGEELAKKSSESSAISFDDKPFNGHITLGRLLYPCNLVGEADSLRNKFNKAVSLSNSAFTVNSFSLFSSVLTKNGPCYKEEAVYNLRSLESIKKIVDQRALKMKKKLRQK